MRETDERWMGLALERARGGEPSPNPHVGAVLLDSRGDLLSTGFHAFAGAAHAEVDALRNATRETAGGTLYVTMEPCNHHGRTGPCTEAIVNAGIGRVVIGARDPHPHVPGAIEKLRTAGVEVAVGILETECAELIEDFAKHISTGLPFVALKMATTLDGKVATRSGHSQWITGPEARKRVHKMRARADAILVGVGTLLADNPSLNVRYGIVGSDPRPIILDSCLRSDPEATIIERATIYHTGAAPEERKSKLLDAGAWLVEVRARNGRVCIQACLEHLGANDVVRLMVEGGSGVGSSFLAEGFVDELSLFIAPKVVGDRDAPGFVEGLQPLEMGDALGFKIRALEHVGDDILLRMKPGHSDGTASQ